MAKTRTTKKKTGTRRRGGRAGRPETLTSSAASLLKELVEDLRGHLEEAPALRAELEAEHRRAREVGRTGLSRTEWLEGELEQVAASWILSVVFVRFCEDNQLIPAPRIAGPVDEDPGRNRLRLAEESQRRYFAEHRAHGDREYLESVFRELAHLPGLGPVLGPEGDASTGGHAAWSRIPLRPEGARRLIEWARQRDDAGEQVRFVFGGDTLDTRFLGDLYQDLSEAARKKFALLQTPDFVESFILDRTLEPALAEFAEEFARGEFRMIDPTCGSGHFLLGGFERLVRHWGEVGPGLDVVERTRRALDAVWGVDLNPFAAAIARFRLLVAALRHCGIERLADAPLFPIHVVSGDSLFFGDRFDVAGGRGVQGLFGEGDPYEQAVMATEDPKALREALDQRYQVVVGNPPYITPKDPALNEAYRARFGSCSGQFALSVPFMERFIDLAVEGDKNHPAGFIGKITSNSFMKREFGKPLVEQYLPRWDLAELVDTSGAYIPGHGTPTVLLFIRKRPPASQFVRVVIGVRGEPGVPEVPGMGYVWSEIVASLGEARYEGRFVSVEKKDRIALASHPLRLMPEQIAITLETMGGARLRSLADIVDAVGRTAHTGADEAYFVRQSAGLNAISAVPLVEGEGIRDYAIALRTLIIFPYDLARNELYPAIGESWDRLIHRLWPWRPTLQRRRELGGTHAEIGFTWYEWSRFQRGRFRTPLSIAFAFVATHNHFVLDRGGKVFKQSAPVIKLPEGATEEEHLALLGVLNSSAVCFWGRQTLFNKGSTVDARGARQTTVPFEDFLEWDATKLKRVPIPPTQPSHRITERAAALSDVGVGVDILQIALEHGVDEARRRDADTLARMIALQEELDWSVYAAYGLSEAGQGTHPDDELPPVGLGERPFEIVMARRMAAGTLQTTWFDRHGSTPVTEIPAGWPSWYRELVQRRIDLIESDPMIGLIEQPECKRRWNVESFDARLARAVDAAILDRIEAMSIWRDDHPRPVTVARLADRLAADPELLRLVDLKTGRTGSDLVAVLESLIAGEAVPFLPGLYLKPSGLRKRAAWEETWRLQRREDPFLDEQDELLRSHFGPSPCEQAEARKHVAVWLTSGGKELGPRRLVSGMSEPQQRELAEVRDRWLAIDQARSEAIGGGDTPPVPPKYGSGDFRSATFWRLRGKLDVPKERFISYPGFSPDGDDTLLIGWAGWDHRQQAAALLQLMQDRGDAGWEAERLVPALQGLDQLVFWLDKWHGRTEHGNLGEIYVEQVQQMTGQFGMTLEQVRGWRP